MAARGAGSAGGSQRGGTTLKTGRHGSSAPIDGPGSRRWTSGSLPGTAFIGSKMVPIIDSSCDQPGARASLGFERSPRRAAPGPSAGSPTQRATRASFDGAGKVGDHVRAQSKAAWPTGPFSRTMSAPGGRRHTSAEPGGRF
jgi:hypothetical protein